MATEVTIFYKAATFFLGFSLIGCSVPVWNNSEYPESRIEYGRENEFDLHRNTSPKDADQEITTSNSSYENILPEPASAIKLESNRLSPEIFPSDVADLLSPEIFSQPDPVLYFLETAVKLPEIKIHMVDNWLAYFVAYEPEIFPARYLPYAKVLRNLLNVLCSLKDVKQSVKKIRRFLTSKYSSLPTGILSPELAKLFSSEVFTDAKLPVQFMIKLINIPIHKINDLKIELRNLYNVHGFPYPYYEYAKAVSTFVQNDFALRRLKKSISELEDVTKSKSSAPNGYLSDNLRLNSESSFKNPSKNVP